jgi:hypothetical protein
MTTFPCFSNSSIAECGTTATSTASPASTRSLTEGAPTNSTVTLCPDFFSKSAASRETPRFTGPAPSIFSVFILFFRFVIGQD